MQMERLRKRKKAVGLKSPVGLAGLERNVGGSTGT